MTSFLDTGRFQLAQGGESFGCKVTEPRNAEDISISLASQAQLAVTTSTAAAGQFGFLTASRTAALAGSTNLSTGSRLLLSHSAA